MSHAKDILIIIVCPLYKLLQKITTLHISKTVTKDQGNDQYQEQMSLLMSWFVQQLIK